MLNGMCAILAFCAALFVGGDKVEVREWKVTFDADFYRVAAHLDPVFLVWGDSPGSACSFFNFVLMDESIKGTEEEAYIFHHEMNHVRQFRALGWLWYPSSQFLQMEWWPRHEEADWDRPEQNDEHMWQPPLWLREWHFLTLELRFG